MWWLALWIVKLWQASGDAPKRTTIFRPCVQGSWAVHQVHLGIILSSTTLGLQYWLRHSSQSYKYSLISSPESQFLIHNYLSNPSFHWDYTYYNLPIYTYHPFPTPFCPTKWNTHSCSPLSSAWLWPLAIALTSLAAIVPGTSAELVITSPVMARVFAAKAKNASVKAEVKTGYVFCIFRYFKIQSWRFWYQYCR